MRASQIEMKALFLSILALGTIVGTSLQKDDWSNTFKRSGFPQAHGLAGMPEAK
jgi:hypothetical protein